MLNQKLLNMKCIKCGEDIHPKRLEILPKTNVCVRCSDAPLYKVTSIQRGEKDYSWNETLIIGKNSIQNG